MNNQQAQDSRALRAVAVQFLINGAVGASFIPRLPEIRDALNIDLAIIGQILALASLGGLMGSWLAGRVIAAISTRSTMIYGTLLLTLLLPMVAFSPSAWVLCLILALMLCTDVIVDIAMNMQGSAISARRSMPVMHRLHGLWSIGSVVGGLLATVMAAHAIPLHWHLLAAAGCMALALWYIAGGLLTTDALIANSLHHGKHQQSRSGASVGSWVFAILGGATFVPEMAGSDWSPFRLSDDLLASPGQASLAYVAFTSGMVIGRMSGDWFSNRLGKARLLNYVISLAAIGLIIACLHNSSTVIYSGLTLAGLGISVLFPALYDKAAQDPHDPIKALGWMTAGSRGVMLIAPLTIGLMANSSFVSVGMAMLFAAIPCLLIVFYLSWRYR